MSADSPRISLVTGGTGALGAAVCDALLAAGGRVHVTYVNDRERDAFSQRFAAHVGRFTLHRADVTAEADVVALFDAVLATDGHVDALACIAGGFAMGPIEDTSVVTFDAQLALNLRSFFLAAREAVRRMKPRGHGRILAVGTRAALDPPSGLSAYAASKAAVLTMVRGLAVELRGSGITVNAVLPGTMDTPANRASMPDADFSRWAKTQDVARVAAFLLAAESSVTSGALVPVYGDS
jgi:NAD(P)-dependent dehydrogenase (short-subunit alcohol dehydrogenase family)